MQLGADRQDDKPDDQAGSTAATNSAPADAKAQVRSSSYATTNVSWNINSSHSSVYRQRMLVQSNIDRMVAAPPQQIDLGRQTLVFVA